MAGRPIDYSLASADLDLDLAARTAESGTDGDHLATIENVIGGAYDDRIRGDAENNRLEGGKGLDLLEGRDGDDTLWGGSDVRQDFLSGGAGNDTVDFSEAPRRVTADLQAGRSEGAGNDVLILMENIWGSVFGDDLRGDDLANSILGGPGDDVIDLRGGDDTADGGLGTDIADGGDGTDSCEVEFAHACE